MNSTSFLKVTFFNSPCTSRKFVLSLMFYWFSEYFPFCFDGLSLWFACLLGRNTLVYCILLWHFCLKNGNFSKNNKNAFWSYPLVWIDKKQKRACLLKEYGTVSMLFKPLSSCFVITSLPSCTGMIHIARREVVRWAIFTVLVFTWPYNSLLGPLPATKLNIFIPIRTKKL